ncbi:MAG: DUF1501 domain-containing protein [Myxococcota bacterium]
MSVVAPAAFGGRDLSFGRRGIAAEAYEGTFFILFNAGGGWDPTSFCDPKGANGENDPDPMNHYLKSMIGEAGNHRFPMEFPNPNDPEGGYGTGIIPAFFEEHYQDLLVINGVDMQTNGHDQGTRHTWSGRLSDGFPTMGAYLAGTYNSTLPMSFLAFGGYTYTAGVAPQSRASNIGALEELAFPALSNSDDPNSSYLSSKSLELIEEAQWHRDQALISGQGLPKIEHSMTTLFESRSGSNELKRLKEFLPEDRSGGVRGQVEVALAAYRAGISVAANISTGGFDTHGDHDARQIPSLENLLDGMSYARNLGQELGIGDKVVLIAGSDFGRTPGYNDGNGKDHWSISSMMMMGAGIEGNRVIGATDEGHRAYGINTDLSVDQSEDVRLKILPAHIHSAIRKRYALGADNELAAMFPLTNEEELPIFG